MYSSGTWLVDSFIQMGCGQSKPSPRQRRPRREREEYPMHPHPRPVLVAPHHEPEPVVYGPEPVEYNEPELAEQEPEPEPEQEPVHVAPQPSRGFRPVRSVQTLGYNIDPEAIGGPDPTITLEERWRWAQPFNYYKIHHPDRPHVIIATLAACEQKPDVLYDSIDVSTSLPDPMHISSFNTRLTEPLGLKFDSFGTAVCFMGLRDPEPHIGTIADLDTLHRIVSHIYPNLDPRPATDRPRAADIFLGFWVVFLGRRIEKLQRIFFQNVEEDTMRDFRTMAFDLMRGGDFSNRLEISCDGDTEMETGIFNQLYNGTKLGRCARTMVTQNLDMLNIGMFVSQFVFEPHPSGALVPLYDFSIIFDVDGVLLAQLRAEEEEQRQQQIEWQQQLDAEEQRQNEAQWQWQQAEWDRQDEERQRGREGHNQHHRRRHHRRSSSRQSHRG